MYYINIFIIHILDILVIESVLFICESLEPLAELDSDHITIKITINSYFQFYKTNDSLINCKPEWDIFSNYL